MHRQNQWSDTLYYTIPTCNVLVLSVSHSKVAYSFWAAILRILLAELNWKPEIPAKTEMFDMSQLLYFGNPHSSVLIVTLHMGQWSCIWLVPMPIWLLIGRFPVWHYCVTTYDALRLSYLSHNLACIKAICHVTRNSELLLHKLVSSLLKSNSRPTSNLFVYVSWTDYQSD